MKKTLPGRLLCPVEKVKIETMIYLIPGLGANYRVFESIHLEGYETTILRWEQPMPNESFESYAKRMTKQVKHTNPVFIGLSFGGLMAAELTKLFPESKLILISSIASRKEMPWWGRLIAALRLHRLFSGTYVKKPNALIRWIFSVAPGRQRELFDSVLRDSDPVFLEWALHVLLNWNGSGVHRLHHIHGKKDRLLPFRYTSADILIEDGAHFTVLTHPQEVSHKLKNILEDIVPQEKME
ncbi:MAG TPA: alpha/beta hydrolase [Bacteroidia bacterium]|nr:alpha/beta hydrolase [Bacteroidia bacterium]